jgi:hypothetical protein
MLQYHASTKITEACHAEPTDKHNGVVATNVEDDEAC